MQRQRAEFERLKLLKSRGTITTLCAKNKNLNKSMSTNDEETTGACSSQSSECDTSLLNKRKYKNKKAPAMRGFSFFLLKIKRNEAG